MRISAVSSNQYTQNFSGVHKVVETLARGVQKTSFVSPKGKLVGEHLAAKSGDVSGWRIFKGGERIDYASGNIAGKTSGNSNSVSYTYKFPDRKGTYLRRWYLFDLDTFKEHMSELTSLKGIKGYLAKIEKAPKVTKYEPCC